MSQYTPRHGYEAAIGTQEVGDSRAIIAAYNAILLSPVSDEERRLQIDRLGQQTGHNQAGEAYASQIMSEVINTIGTEGLGGSVYLTGLAKVISGRLLNSAVSSSDIAAISKNALRVIADKQFPLTDEATFFASQVGGDIKRREESQRELRTVERQELTRERLQRLSGIGHEAVETVGRAVSMQGPLVVKVGATAAIMTVGFSAVAATPASAGTLATSIPVEMMNPGSDEQLATLVGVLPPDVPLQSQRPQNIEASVPPVEPSVDEEAVSTPPALEGKLPDDIDATPPAVESPVPESPTLEGKLPDEVEAAPPSIAPNPTPEPKLEGKLPDDIDAIPPPESTPPTPAPSAPPEVTPKMPVIPPVEPAPRPSPKGPPNGEGEQKLNPAEINLVVAKEMAKLPGEMGRAGRVMVYMLQHTDLTPGQISGASGNFSVESFNTRTGEGINSDQVQGNGKGPAHGMMQWEGVRLDQLRAFAAERGKEWSDFNLQLEFIVHEFETSEKRCYQKLQQAGTVREAAVTFRKFCERPSVAHDDRRIEASTKIYKAYDEIRAKYVDNPGAPDVEDDNSDKEEKPKPKIVGWGEGAGGKHELTYFNQRSDEWADKPYRKNNSPESSGTIEVCGCGPSALSMSIATMTGRKTDPIKMSEWFMDHGGPVSSSNCASNWIWESKADSFESDFGVKIKRISGTDEAIKKAIDKGGMVIMSQGSGMFTSGGHIMMVTGYVKTANKDGGNHKYLVGDSNSTRKTVDLEGYSPSVMIGNGSPVPGVGLGGAGADRGYLKAAWSITPIKSEVKSTSSEIPSSIDVDVAPTPQLEINQQDSQSPSTPTETAPDLLDVLATREAVEAAERERIDALLFGDSLESSVDGHQSELADAKKGTHDNETTGAKERASSSEAVDTPEMNPGPRALGEGELFKVRHDDPQSIENDATNGSGAVISRPNSKASDTPSVEFREVGVAIDNKAIAKVKRQRDAKIQAEINEIKRNIEIQKEIEQLQKDLDKRVEAKS